MAEILLGNIKGPKGDDGTSFKISGYYATLDELIFGVPHPESGEAYGVGSTHPYEIYIYSPKHGWVNNGTIQGVKGEKGDRGEQGIPGIQGLQGEKGEKGDQGIQGEKGDKGDQGIQGIQGIQGEQGVKGDKGDKGERGEQGIQGEKGEKGDKGDKGDTASITVNNKVADANGNISLNAQEISAFHNLGLASDYDTVLAAASIPNTAGYTFFAVQGTELISAEDSALKDHETQYLVLVDTSYVGARRTVIAFCYANNIIKVRSIYNGAWLNADWIPLILDGQSVGNSDMVDGLHSYNLATLNALGESHGTDHPMYCKHNLRIDNRFGIGVDGYEVGVDYATKASTLTGVLPESLGGTGVTSIQSLSELLGIKKLESDLKRVASTIGVIL